MNHVARESNYGTTNPVLDYRSEPGHCRSLPAGFGRYGDKLKPVEWYIHHLNPSDWLVGLEVLECRGTSGDPGY